MTRVNFKEWLAANESGNNLLNTAVNMAGNVLDIPLDGVDLGGVVNYAGNMIAANYPKFSPQEIQNLTKLCNIQSTDPTTRSNMAIACAKLCSSGNTTAENRPQVCAKGGCGRVNKPMRGRAQNFVYKCVNDKKDFAKDQENKIIGLQ